VATVDPPVATDLADAGIADVPATVAELAFFAGGRHPRPDLLGRCSAGGIEYVSGRELVDRVRDVSLGLMALGLRAGDRVAILSESRPEWLVADLAVLAAGAITTPLYPTLSAEQTGVILEDSGASVAVVSNAAQLEKLLAARSVAPALRTAVVIDPAGVDRAAAPIPVLDLGDVAARGHQKIVDGWGVARAFQDTAKRVRPSDPATLIYTSGTTATPKGVTLTHANLVANIAGIRAVLRLDEADTALSFLPLCHAFERMVAYVYLVSGVSMIFAESIDSVPRDLLKVRPTIMTGVPRVFEKLLEKIHATGRAQRGVRRAIFEWSLGVASRRGARLADGGRRSPAGDLEARIADALVLRRVREGLGGRLRFAVSGGAPLRPEIGQFFYGAGVPILEGYGLTETSPVVCVMPLERIRFGTVGPPLPNVRVRVADDGEILVQGASVMTGYYRRPEDTAAVLHDGWFSTGDLGALDAAGYLKITGRKKEILVTSGGKKIVPEAVENALRAQPPIEEAVVIAEQRKFASALIVPRIARLCQELGCARPADRAAREALLARPEVRARLQAAVDAVNAHLAQFERVRKFEVLADEFSQATGELTPTLKVKRRVVEEKYRDAIERMYA